MTAAEIARLLRALRPSFGRLRKRAAYMPRLARYLGTKGGIGGSQTFEDGRALEVTMRPKWPCRRRA